MSVFFEVSPWSLWYTILNQPCRQIFQHIIKKINKELDLSFQTSPLNKHQSHMSGTLEKLTDTIIPVVIG